MKPLNTSPISPESPSSPSRVERTAWDDLRDYEDPRNLEPAISVEYNSDDVGEISQADIDSIGLKLSTLNDANEAQDYMERALVSKGFSLDDIQDGLVPARVNGELVAMVARADDFGTRIIRANLTPRQSAPELDDVSAYRLPDLADYDGGRRAPIDPSDLPNLDQGEKDSAESPERAEEPSEDMVALGKLMTRLDDALYESRVEGGLNEHDAFYQRMKVGLHGTLNLAKDTANLLLSGQLVDRSSLLRLEGAVIDAVVAANIYRGNAEQDRGLVPRLSSGFTEISHSAQNYLDSESPEREQFHRLTGQLEGMCSDLQTATNMGLQASEDLSINLRNMLAVIQELKSSRHGHETFGSQVKMYVTRIQDALRQSDRGSSKSKAAMQGIKQLLG